MNYTLLSFKEKIFSEHNHNYYCKSNSNKIGHLLTNI